MFIEKLIHVQLAMFFETPENRPDKLANKIEDVVKDVFDQMPNIIPLPSEAPPEIPRVIMQSSDGVFTCNIGSNRVDFIGNFANFDGEIDSIFDEFLIKAYQFLEAVFESKRVIRFGLVGQYFFQEDDLTEKLKNKYFKTDIGQFDELNLKFNKRFNFEDLKFNDIIDINQGLLNGSNGVEFKGGFIQKDMNNIPSTSIDLNKIKKLIELNKVKFSKEKIRELIN
ncbi:MAG: hypothetical protein ABS942_15875 [Solibacillus sp.]